MKSNLRSYLGLMPSIADNVMIDPSSIIIGDARLSEHVSVWPLTVIRADVNYIEIGAYTNIQDGSVLHTTHKSQSNPRGNPLIVGKYTTIGHRVMLHGCQIGDRVLVGMGSIILDNAIIEDDVIIGAGSLVTQGKRLASGYLYIGSPATAVRKLTEEERQQLIYSANNYASWKDNYLTDSDYRG